MKYTENYHLPQWDETDRIMRTDFNRMCADMEAGLERNLALAAADAAKSQATADKAVTDAAKAQSKADAAYSPSQPPYVVGTYTATGEEQTVEVGFRPRFLIITLGNKKTYFIIGGDLTYATHFSFTNTGFSVKKHYDTIGVGTTMKEEKEPFLANVGATYCYIAFR